MVYKRTKEYRERKRSKNKDLCGFCESVKTKNADSCMSCKGNLPELHRRVEEDIEKWRSLVSESKLFKGKV
jgi:hypothetical protein